jgi:hypothetical protein
MRRCGVRRAGAALWSAPCKCGVLGWRAGGLRLVSTLWLLAGQDVGTVWPHLANSIEISASFAEAMALEGPAEVLLSLIASVLLLGAAFRSEWDRSRYLTLIPATALAALLFLTFKAGFVRHDAHALSGGYGLFSIVLLYCPALWQEIQGRLHAALCAGALVAAIALA